MKKIAFGGGCHWCTEAVFQLLKGVTEVQQGWISSTPPNETFSEAVIVYYDPEVISLHLLIETHLESHASNSNHAMRDKYRSAIYFFSEEDERNATLILNSFRTERTFITQVLPFRTFKINEDQFLNYYKTNPAKPFCKVHILPKLKKLSAKHPSLVNQDLINN